MMEHLWIGITTTFFKANRVFLNVDISKSTFLFGIGIQPWRWAFRSVIASKGIAVISTKKRGFSFTFILSQSDLKQLRHSQCFSNKATPERSPFWTIVPLTLRSDRNWMNYAFSTSEAHRRKMCRKLTSQTLQGVMWRRPESESKREADGPDSLIWRQTVKTNYQDLAGAALVMWATCCSRPVRQRLDVEICFTQTLARSSHFFENDCELFSQAVIYCQRHQTNTCSRLVPNCSKSKPRYIPVWGVKIPSGTRVKAACVVVCGYSCQTQSSCVLGKVLTRAFLGVENVPGAQFRSCSQGVFKKFPGKVLAVEKGINRSTRIEKNFGFSFLRD